jgi:hypothetical protein
VILGLKILGAAAALYLFPAEGAWPPPWAGWARLAALMIAWAAIWGV